MDITVFALMLVSAALHATWNGWVKSRADSATAIAAVAIGAAVPNTIVLAVFGVPGAQVWPWIAATVVASILGMNLTALAYREGDFAVAYPLMRGFTPVLLIVTAIPLFGETPSLVQALGVLAISGGLALIGWEAAARSRTMTLRGLGLTALSAAVVATGAMVDAKGARLSESPFSYAATISFLNGVSMALFQRLRGHRLPALVREQWPLFTFGAAISIVSYVLYIWSLMHAPVALVAALRETSMLFAVLIGALILRERVSSWRWFAVAVMFTGMMLIRL